MIKCKRKNSIPTSDRMLNSLFAFHLLLISINLSACSVSFNGIPVAIGDLDLNKRTDIVVIGDDGTRIDIHYQHQPQAQQLLELGFSCKTDKPVVQVYLDDINSDGNPDVLPLLLVGERGGDKLYHLKSLKHRKSVDSTNFPSFSSPKLGPNTEYKLAMSAASGNDLSASNSSNNSPAESLPMKDPPNCEFTDLGVEMRAQPLLFDLEGDLRTDFMSVNKDGLVTVWKPPKDKSSDLFEMMPPREWSWIGKEYFAGPHSNSFIDINNDFAADIVLSAKGARIAYLFADPDPAKNFKNYSRQFLNMEDDIYEYGQSSFVDIKANGSIDHIIPRCKKDSHHCEIIVLFSNGKKEEIFNFRNVTNGDPSGRPEFQLESYTFAENYEFPISLRPSDLDGDGFTDFVVVAKSNQDNKNKILYLHNIPDPRASSSNGAIVNAKSMTRTFEMQVIPFNNLSHTIHLITLFDLNEDGKVDMLIGSSENDQKPSDLSIREIMNTQMVDACFMKVLVTNGFYMADSGSYSQIARGPFICFELSQNDGNKMQGCAGQLSQSSHFALQSPYVIFGLGQTPHFVETLNVSIPGFGRDGKVRTRRLDQIVPDAQVVIIPNQPNNTDSWDYKLFLSPMSELVFSTLAALAILCVIILIIICVLHRRESIEDAAEHEEYKRHWPESR